MKCPNCGSGVSGLWCKYCKSFVSSSDEEKQILSEVEQKKQEVLNSIEYIKNTHAPEEVKEKKLKVLQRKLEELN